MKKIFANKTFRVIVLLLVLAGVTAIVGSCLNTMPPRIQKSGVQATQTPQNVATRTPDAVPFAKESAAPTTDAATTQTPDAAATQTPDVMPAAKESTAPAASDATATPRPANAYVVVTAGGESRIFPLPDEGEAKYKLVLHQQDGRETTNVICLTPEGMRMEFSSCDNQLCVEQGEVTLSNRAHRLLGNQIICLPNNVLMEMYTPDELLAAVKGQENR